MRRIERCAAIAGVCLALLPASRVTARPACSHAVVFALPGTTWSEVHSVGAPEIMGAARSGAAGSVSVRTNSSRTSYASGFATMGAGARVDGGVTTGGTSTPHPTPRPLARGVRVSGLGEMDELARKAGYDAVPGALGAALEDIPVAAIGSSDPGPTPPLPAGFGRWAALAAMDDHGRVDLSATGSAVLEHARAWPFATRTDPTAVRDAVRSALARPCSVLIIDPGDLARADMAAVATRDSGAGERASALMTADGLLGYVRSLLDPRRDLLLVVSPTSPEWSQQAHLGVAVAVGPEFHAGMTLVSASTRRPGIVTLPDVAPTVLAHLGVHQPPSMNGRPLVGVAPVSPDRVHDAIDLDRESVFVDGVKSGVTTGYVVFQVLLYSVAIPLLTRGNGGRGVLRLGRWARWAALAVVAFPAATYLAGIVSAHELGAPVFVGMLVVIDAVLVAAACSVARPPLRALGALVGFTTLLVVSDLVASSRLQLNTVFGYSPIVAGRFSGAGNITFAVLGVAGLLTGSLLVHEWPRTSWALAVTAALFAVVVVVDGAPQLGSDVGGTLALVPALGITWLVLSGRRPRVTVVLVTVVAAVAALGAFLALDLSRPPQSQTHLARLWLDITERGAGVLVDTLRRKTVANLRVFTSTIFTLFVPPALGIMAWLLRRPRGSWERVARAYPRLRAGLVGGLILAVLGFAVNDSGIVVPAVILSYLVPMALLIHLGLASETA